MKTLLLLGLAAGLVVSLSAATFTVTSIADEGVGSLRQAILDANASAGELDTIEFNVPGEGFSGVQVIRAVDLPAITDPVILDGTTQPGYAGVPLILLNGEGLLATDSGGLTIMGGNSVVRGLAIGYVGRCCDAGQRPALLLTGGGTNRVEACFIGLDPLRPVSLLNASAGLVISNSAGNVIGGAEPAAGNVISGNQGAGLQVVGPLAVDNRIQGNFIGTDVTGTNAVGNGQGGVEIYGAAHTLIGGPDRGMGNVISGNGGQGILLAGHLGQPASDTVIFGNLLGLPLFAPTVVVDYPASGGRKRPQSTPGEPSRGTADCLEHFLVWYLARTGPVVPDDFQNREGDVLNALADRTAVGGLVLPPVFPMANLMALGPGKSAVVATTGNGLVLGGNGYLNLHGDSTADVALAPEVNGGVTVSPVVTKAGDRGGTLQVEGVASAPAQTAVVVEVRRNFDVLSGAGGHAAFSFPMASLSGTAGEDGKFAFAVETESWGDLVPRTGGTVVATATLGGAMTSPDSGPLAMTIIPDLRPDSFGWSGHQADALLGAWNPWVHRQVYVAAAGSVRLRPVRLHSVLPGPLSLAGPDLVAAFPAPLLVPFAQDVIVPIPQPADLAGNRYQFGFADLLASEGGGMLTGLASVVLVSPPSLPAQAPALGSFMPNGGGFGLTWEGYYHLQASTNPAGPWTTLPGTISPYAALAAGVGGFFRLTGDVPTGAIFGDVADTGVPGGTVVQVGAGGPVAATYLGQFSLPQVPAGEFDLLVHARMAVTDGATGARDDDIVAVGWPMAVAPGKTTRVVITRVEFSQPAAQTPCQCTPWCGLLGGTVEGVPQVVAFGGMLGECGEIPEVTITTPDGTQIHNPQGRMSFSPAPNGTYSVTATVCGVTRTCSITLP